MRTIIFETHATSLDNESGLASGWHDVDLSETGRRQAHEMAARYDAKRLQAIYASDLRRAARTAAIAFERSGVPVKADARLRECDYGSLTRAPVEQVDGVRLSAIHTPFPGGESYEQVTARVHAWLLDIERLACGEEPILAVGHRGTFYALEHLLRGRSLEEVIAAEWRWQPGWAYQLA